MVYVQGQYTVRSESRCTLIKVLEVISTSIYTDLNPFNFIRKHFLRICLRKVAVHLKVVEVISASVDIGLNLKVPKPTCTATFRTHSVRQFLYTCDS
jgi:hypothetical protein